MSTTHKLAIIPDRLLFSARRAITQATGCQVTAEANAIIQATLDYLTAQPAVPAMLMTSAMRAELVDDTAATFYANSPETPQVVRDVIEYVDSWLQVQLGRAQDAAQATPDALQAATAARIQAQTENAALKDRLARARIDLMKELEEQGWTPPAAPVAVPLPDIASAEVNDACWAFIDAMPHPIPGRIWNDLKPAVYAAICKFLNARNQAQAAPVAVPIMTRDEVYGLLGKAEYFNPGISHTSRADFVNGARHAERHLAARWGVKLAK